MAEPITVARPYAKAAFDYAVEHNELEQWQQMLLLVSTVCEQESIQSILVSDKRSDEIADIFIKICGDSLNESMKNLIKVMASNHRLSLLSDVLALFVHYRQEKERVLDMDVISAFALSDKQYKEIQRAMETRFKRTVHLIPQIDQSLISGFILRAGDFVMDYSIKASLNRLGVALQS